MQGRGHGYWAKRVSGHKQALVECPSAWQEVPRGSAVPPLCNRPGAEGSGGGWSVLRSKWRLEANYPHWGWSS